MRLKLIIGLWISLIILASCEERADYLNWSRKVANYCRYVKFSEESKRYECGPKLGEFYTYIIVHPDYDLPKNPIYPLVAYDGNDNVVMVGGNGRGQIWRMIKFEIWAFVRETKTGMKEVYYDKEEKAFIGLEMGDNKEDIKSKAWWSRDGGKSWVRAKVPLFKKKKSNSVVPVPSVVGVTPKPKLPIAPPPFVAPAGPKLPVGGVAEAVGGGYAVAIGKVGGKPAVWRSVEKVPRDWKVTGDFHGGATSLPPSLSKPGELEGVKFEGGKFEITDTEGIEWTYEDIRNRWEISKVDFAGGDGTVGNPYQIASSAQLWQMRNHLTSHFELIKDLDLSVITEEEGFDPIGDRSNRFEGTFDGKGKVIRNLRIDRSTEDEVGLFGFFIGEVLKNIGLEDVDVKGKDGVGGLVGYGYADRIENSYATGKVRGKEYVGGLMGSDVTRGITRNSYANVDVSGDRNVGGLIGYHNNQARIENSYAMGDVAGIGDVGGLVGYNDGRIENSYATGTVTGTGSKVGGLVGDNDGGTVKNSYATGDVTGSGDYVGGLVGISSGTIEKSYATGAVTGRSSIGGLLGFLTEDGDIFGKNYWKEGSASKGVEVGGGGNIIKKTDAELKALDAGETGWNEDEEIWNFQAGQYPKLAWQD